MSAVDPYPFFTCNPSATVRRYVIRVPDFGGDRSPSLPLPAPGHEALRGGDPVLLPGKARRWLTDISLFALKLQPRVPFCAQGFSLPRGCADASTFGPYSQLVSIYNPQEIRLREIDHVALLNIKLVVLWSVLFFLDDSIGLFNNIHI